MLGVFIAIYYPLNWRYFLFIILLGIILIKWIEYQFNRKLRAYPFHTMRWGIVVMLISLGFFRVDVIRDINRGNHFSKISGSIYKIEVSEFGTTKYQNHRFKARVIQTKQGKKIAWTTGNVLVYWDTALGSAPKLGQKFWVKTDFLPIPHPKNPKEFNYQQYLIYYNVYFKTYIKSKESFVRCDDDAIGFTAALNSVRSNAQSIFKRYLNEPHSYLIAQALVLGGKNNLDEEVKSNFAHTGTLHVLAVSGLHMGIVFLLVQFLIGLLKKKIGIGEMAQIGFILCSIWFYALVTGFSPSVQRASCMFTLLSLGELIHGRQNGINSLCASAFIMLSFNPYLIVNVGFQLSYAAVLGIMLIYRPIYMLVSFRMVGFKFLWMFLDKAWAVCCVSLSAQLATLPISLFYFGQFPTYFLFSNLFVIPLVFVLVFLAFVLIVTSPISILAEGIACCFSWISKMLLMAVEKVAHLPYAYASGLHLDFVHVVILYLVLANVIRGLHFKRLRYFNFAGLCLILYLALFNTKYVRQGSQTKFLLHSIKHRQVITLIQGNQATIISDSSFAANTSAQKFYLTPYLRSNYIKGIRRIAMKHKLAAVQRQNDTLLLYTDSSKYPDLKLFTNENKQISWLLNRNSYTDTLANRYDGRVIWTSISPFFQGGGSKFPSLDSFAVDMAM